MRPGSRFFFQVLDSSSSGGAAAPGSSTAQCVTVSGLRRAPTPDARRLCSCGARRPVVGNEPVIFSKCLGGSTRSFPCLTPDWARGKGVTNRWDGEAESQWIVAARLLYHLQYLVPYLSRLQRIHLPDRLKLNAKRPRWYVSPARGSSRHMLLGAHARPY